MQTLRTAGDLCETLDEGKTKTVVVSSKSLGQTKDETPSDKINEREKEEAAIRMMNVVTKG